MGQQAEEEKESEEPTELLSEIHEALNNLKE